MSAAEIDIEEVAAIEILIQALDAQAKRGGFEIGHAKAKLRAYLDSHSAKDFEAAKTAFEQIGFDIRSFIRDEATGIAKLSNS